MHIHVAGKPALPMLPAMPVAHIEGACWHGLLMLQDLLPAKQVARVPKQKRPPPVFEPPGGETETTGLRKITRASAVTLAVLIPK